MKKLLSVEELVKMEKDYNERHQCIGRDSYNDDMSFFVQKHRGVCLKNLIPVGKSQKALTTAGKTSGFCLNPRHK